MEDRNTERQCVSSPPVQGSSVLVPWTGGGGGQSCPVCPPSCAARGQSPCRQLSICALGVRREVELQEPVCSCATEAFTVKAELLDASGEGRRIQQKP